MRVEVNRNVELVQVILFLTEQQEKTYQKVENKTYTDAEEEYKVQKEKFIFIDRFANAMKEFEESEKTFAQFYRERIGDLLDVGDN